MPASNFYQAMIVWCKESVKLWAIAGPIDFNILSNYGTNSFIDIFVEHIGDDEAFVDESFVVVEIELVFSSQNRAHHAVERSPFQDVPDEEIAITMAISAR